MHSYSLLGDAFYPRGHVSDPFSLAGPERVPGLVVTGRPAEGLRFTGRPAEGLRFDPSQQVAMMGGPPEMNLGGLLGAMGALNATDRPDEPSPMRIPPVAQPEPPTAINPNWLSDMMRLRGLLSRAGMGESLVSPGSGPLAPSGLLMR